MMLALLASHTLPLMKTLGRRA